jgi:hypothetical protein
VKARPAIVRAGIAAHQFELNKPYKGVAVVWVDPHPVAPAEDRICNCEEGYWVIPDLAHGPVLKLIRQREREHPGYGRFVTCKCRGRLVE